MSRLRHQDVRATIRADISVLSRILADIWRVGGVCNLVGLQRGLLIFAWQVVVNLGIQVDSQESFLDWWPEVCPWYWDSWNSL